MSNDKLAEALRDAEATVLAFLGDVAFDGSVCGIKQAIVKGMFARLQAHAAEAAQAQTPYDYAGLAKALRTQRQVDADGTEVGMSRQACDEAADIIDSLAKAAQTQAAQDAKDGARYRFLADHQDADLYMENPGNELLDRAIDAAMAKESGR